MVTKRKDPWFWITMLLNAATITVGITSIFVGGWSLVAATLCLLTVSALCTFRALRAACKAKEDPHS